MKTYKLTLTNESGEVLDQWTIGNTEHDDYSYPVHGLIVEDINAEIKKDLN